MTGRGKNAGKALRDPRDRPTSEARPARLAGGAKVVVRARFVTVATVAVAVFAAVAACATPQPTPMGLTAAHTALLRAQLGPARDQAPAHVARAELGFAVARTACARNPGGSRCRDLSYVALRRAEQAEREANVILAHRTHQHAHLTLAARRAQQASSQKAAAAASEADDKAAAAAELWPDDPALQRAARKLRSAKTGSPVHHDPQRGIVMRLGRVQAFAPGSSRLSAASRRELAALASALQSSGPGRLQVTTEAEVDETHELARARTQAVMAHLIACGVPAVTLRSAPAWADGARADATADACIELVWQPTNAR